MGAHAPALEGEVDEAAAKHARAWFSDVFTETSQLTSFLNAVGMEPAQISSLQFGLASPNIWRILLICWLTPEQDELRRQWQATESTLRGRKQEVAAGSAH